MNGQSPGGRRKTAPGGARGGTHKADRERRGGGKSARLAPYFLHGKHAVTAALGHKNRICHELLCAQGALQEPDGPVPAARGRGVPVTPCDAQRLEKLSGGAVHQGYLLKVSPLEHDMPAFAGERHTVMILDHVTDPQNIGAVLRSAGAFGAEAVFVHERGSPGENAVIAKAACGFLETVKYIAVKNIAELISSLQKQGFSVAALDADADALVHQAAFAGKQAFLMGSEGKGVRRLPMERADLRLRIPMAPGAESLNISVAAGVCLYARFVNGA